MFVPLEEISLAIPPAHLGATMADEKAAEGNVAYFAEFPGDVLDAKLAKFRDEDGRTLLHTAAAAGACSRSSPPAPRPLLPPPRPRDARLTPDAPASSPTPPSRTAAGKTELVELFLGTPAGRALVNVGDEVRDAAPRVGRLDERVGVPTSFFLAAAADPTSRERPAPFPPSFLTPRRPARSDPARSDPARVRRPTGLRFTPRAAPATSSACASSSPRARTPTARTRAGRGARTTPPAKAASTRSSR